MKRIRAVLRRRRVIFLLLALLLVIPAWPGSYSFSVSKETTYFTRPVDDHGMIDYGAAVNDYLAEGIRPEDNAMVLLIKVLGPKPDGNRLPAEYFDRLQTAEPTDTGDLFIPIDEFAERLQRSEPKQDDPEDAARAFNHLVRQRKARLGSAVFDTYRQPWTEKEQPDVAAWLKANERPLAILEEASTRPHFYSPIVNAAGTDYRALRAAVTAMIGGRSIRQLSQALASRALLHVAHRRYAEAWRDLMTLQRLGRVLSRSQNPFHFLVAVACASIAVDGQLVLLHHARPDTEQSLTWLQEYRRLPPFPPFGSKLNLQRFVMLCKIMSVVKDGPDVLEHDDLLSENPKPSRPIGVLRRSINFDAAFREVNGVFDQWIAAYDEPDRAARTRRISELESQQLERQNARSIGAFEKFTMGKNHRGAQIAKSVIAGEFMSLDDGYLAAERAVQNAANLQIAFALAAYRADRGRYPEKLDELTPRYLPNIPMDRFSDQPLIYQVIDGGYQVYSVGRNGKAEGGRTELGWIMGDDIGIRMPPAGHERLKTID